jgi:hypothetical protein
VDSVSRKETGDEVVLAFKIFYPSVFDFNVGIIIIFTCLLSSHPFKGVRGF